MSERTNKAYSGDIGADTHLNNNATASATTVKSSQGNLYGIHIGNPNSSDVFLQVFDDTSPNVGTDTPKQSYRVDSQSSLNKSMTVPIKFDNGISYAITTTSTGNTSPSTASVVNVIYK